MLGTFRVCALAALAAALACAPAAHAAEKAKVKQEEGVPRPQMKPAKKRDPVTPVPPPVVLASPMPHDDFPDSAPRIGGLAAQATGGASCRTDCAKSYYRCLADDDMSSCSPAWSQCLVGCPAISSSE
jgi:hypothetical protein